MRGSDHHDGVKGEVNELDTCRSALAELSGQREAIVVMSVM